MNKKEAMVERLKGKAVSQCRKCGEYNMSVDQYLDVEEDVLHDYLCKCGHIWYTDGDDYE